MVGMGEREEAYSGSETAGMMPSMVVTCLESSSDTSQTIIFPSAPHDVYREMSRGVFVYGFTTHQKRTRRMPCYSPHCFRMALEHNHLVRVLEVDHLDRGLTACCQLASEENREKRVL